MNETISVGWLLFLVPFTIIAGYAIVGIIIGLLVLLSKVLQNDRVRDGIRFIVEALANIFIAFMIFFIFWFGMSMVVGSFANAAEINPELSAKLVEFETASKCSFTKTSGVRTVEHNKKVGGASKSYHLTGDAYDLVPKCDTSLKKLGKIAAKIFNGVIVYKKHIHVDVRVEVFHKGF